MRRLFVVLVFVGAVALLDLVRAYPAGLNPLRHLRGGHRGHTMQVVSGTNTAVSDEQAYMLFFKSMASASNPRVPELALAQAGLDVSDRRAFVQALVRFRTDLAAMEQRGTARLAPLSFRNERQAAFNAARLRVQAGLSPKGSEQLHNYIQNQVKSRIKTYTSPMTAPPRNK